MRFAHLSDIHLGFQQNPELQRVEREVFEWSLDECIAREVDFILIAGDMFHINIPDIRVQRYAFAKFRQVHEAGIPVYIVYGSHDFSPVADSVIDLLLETGYITKIVRGRGREDGKVELEFVTDPRTGAKIAGLSGLKASLDIEIYQNLERTALEEEPGFKIFMFHGGIADMKSDPAAKGEYMPLSYLPKGFAYYAGGHLHRWNHQEFKGYPHVVYPGTPFAGHYADFEASARGQARGFAVVEFGRGGVESVEFVEAKGAPYEMIRVDGDGKSPDSINAELLQKAGGADLKGKIVVVKLSGEMATGKTSEVDISALSQKVEESGALAINTARGGLTSKEYNITKVSGANRDEIEANVFGENIGQVRLDQEELLGERGVDLARRLLLEIRQPQGTNEQKGKYEERICGKAMEIMGLDSDDS